MIGADEVRNEVGMYKFVCKTAQNPIPEVCSFDCLAVVAGALGNHSIVVWGIVRAKRRLAKFCYRNQRLHWAPYCFGRTRYGWLQAGRSGHFFHLWVVAALWDEAGFC